MKTKDYLPHNEAQLTLWSESFKTQFAAQAAGLGFGETEVEAMNTACNSIVSGIADVGTAKIIFEEKVSQKNKIVETNSTDIRDMVRRIKASPTYTEAIGKLLGIVAEGSSFDPTTALPYVTLVKSATGYDFKFNLMNYFDAVAVFRRKPGETGFTQVAIDMKPPYEVDSPVESGTEFKFQYMKNDKLMGQPSDIIAVY